MVGPLSGVALDRWHRRSILIVSTCLSAVQAIVSLSYPGQFRSEAAYAALGGTSPLPASSGQTVRHRLNRGGDRALNRAIHAIALVRMRSCPCTRAYVARRTA